MAADEAHRTAFVAIPDVGARRDFGMKCGNEAEASPDRNTRGEDTLAHLFTKLAGMRVAPALTEHPLHHVGRALVRNVHNV